MTTKEPQEVPGVEESPNTIFDVLIFPLSRDSFLSDFWGSRFLRLAGHQGKFEFLLSWEELNSILEQYQLDPPRLRLVREAKTIDPSRYLGGNNERSKLRPGALVNFLSEGATLILDSVDELAPGVGRLAESWQEVLRSRTSVNLYASWRTQKGFDLHWDPQDTMILQVSGRKHWKVYPPTRLHPLEHDAAPPKPIMQPVWDGILEDGDMVYIPRGWWHVAYPLDEPSLHLTVTIVPADGVDLLRWIIEQLKAHPEIRMNVPYLASDSDRKKYVERMRRLLAKTLSDNVLERFMAEWEVKIPLRPSFRLPLGPIESRAPITLETKVRLASSRRVAFIGSPTNGIASFVACGIRSECSMDLVPALDRLSGTASCSVAELCAALPDQTTAPKLMILLSALAMRGALQLERPELQ